MIDWLRHVMGLDNASGGWYLFHSGIGGRLAVLAPMLLVWRRFNCEIAGCHRIGRHKSAADHMLCRKHHPDDHLTVDRAHEMHREALDGGPDGGADDAV